MQDRLVNLKLIIEYDGKNYFGWQRQAKKSGKKTIQQVIEDSLQLLFKNDKITLTGAGRTDAGVHAYAQCANVKVNENAYRKFGPEKLKYSLNSLLPYDIVIKKISRAKDNFHARYSAKERSYEYLLTSERHAIGYEKLFRLKTKFDIDLAREFCKLLLGYRSFKSLCKNSSDKHDFMCDVKSVSVKKSSKGIIRFEITASRFLHSMVRAITGAMVYIAAGKLSINEFKSKFNKGEPVKIQYLPANALFLVKVKY